MRRLAGSVLTVMLLAVPLSCIGPEKTALNAVPPPPLSALSETSQEQYRSFRDRIDQAGETTPAAELGSAWGALAQWYEVYRFFDGARLAYDNAHRLEPQEPRWPYHLGRLAVRSGESTRAEEMLRRAFELEPSHLPTAVRLAELLVSQTREDEAEPLFQQSLDQNPACARCRAGLANIALRRGDLDFAAAELERALEDQPNATPLSYQLGIVYRQQGRDSEAAELLGQASSNAKEHRQILLGDPWMNEMRGLNQSVAAHQERGTEAFRRGRWVAAEREYRLALADDPNNLKARQNLALALVRQNRIDEAMAEIEAALEADPSSPAAHNTLAMLLTQVGRIEEAETHLLVALQTDPDAKRVHFNLAQLRLRSNRPEEAIPHFDRAVDLDPRLGMARHGRAVALWHQGRRQDAVEGLSRDLDAQPDNQSLLNLMARFRATAIESGLRDGSRALELVNQAARAGENVAVAETRAMVLFELGRFDEASAWQRAAIASLNRTPQRSALARARARLKLYQAGRPAGEAWAVDESPLPIPVTRPAGLVTANPSGDN